MSSRLRLWIAVANVLCAVFTVYFAIQAHRFTEKTRQIVEQMRQREAIVTSAAHLPENAHCVQLDTDDVKGFWIDWVTAGSRAAVSLQHQRNHSGLFYWPAGTIGREPAYAIVLDYEAGPLIQTPTHGPAKLADALSGHWTKEW